MAPNIFDKGTCKFGREVEVNLEYVLFWVGSKGQGGHERGALGAVLDAASGAPSDCQNTFRQASVWLRDLTEDGDVENHPGPGGEVQDGDERLFLGIVAINANRIHPPVVRDGWGRVTTSWGTEGHLRDLLEDHKRHKWAIAGLSELGALDTEIKALREKLREEGLGIKATGAKEGRGSLNKAGAAIIYDITQVEWVKGSTEIIIAHRAIKAEMKFIKDQTRVEVIAACMPVDGTGEKETEEAWDALIGAVGPKTVILTDANADWETKKRVGDQHLSRLLNAGMRDCNGRQVTHGTESKIDYILAGSEVWERLRGAGCRTGWASHGARNVSGGVSGTHNIVCADIGLTIEGWGEDLSLIHI